MKIKLVAKTELVDWPEEYQPHTITKFSGTNVLWEEDIDELAEIAGRLCYESWNRPNPDTASNDGYLRNILGQKHYSVLEHGSASFYIEGVSRSLLAELSRHRHLSFSVLSQRYVNHGRNSGASVAIPPVVRDVEEFVQELEEAFNHAQLLYDKYVELLLARGMTRKEARGAARAFLPEATATKMIVTGNMRSWREVIGKRYSPAADAEICELARLLLVELKKIAPGCFLDMEL